MAVDLNKLSAPALKAAMTGGTMAWGKMGSASENVRYAEMLPNRPGRPRMCLCGCEQKKTHVGMANGVALMSGCHMRVLRWVRGL